MTFTACCGSNQRQHQKGSGHFIPYLPDILTPTRKTSTEGINMYMDDHESPQIMEYIGLYIVRQYRIILINCSLVSIDCFNSLKASFSHSYLLITVTHIKSSICFSSL